MDQGDGQAGLSHGGWPALPMAPVTPGMKRGPPSKSPKKVEAKMVRQMQQQVQQQAGHPMPTQVYLPSAPMSLKHYQTSKKSLDSLSQEWDCLGRQTRAAQVLYTSTGAHDQQQMVLTQPVQASRIIAQPVPQIQPSELRLRNAGTC